MELRSVIARTVWLYNVRLMPDSTLSDVEAGAESWGRKLWGEASSDSKTAGRQRKMGLWRNSEKGPESLEDQCSKLDRQMQSRPYSFKEPALSA